VGGARTDRGPADRCVGASPGAAADPARGLRRGQGLVGADRLRPGVRRPATASPGADRDRPRVGTSPVGRRSVRWRHCGGGPGRRQRPAHREGGMSRLFPSPDDPRPRQVTIGASLAVTGSVVMLFGLISAMTRLESVEVTNAIKDWLKAWHLGGFDL